jgi:dienelactone hydrolase
MATLSEECCTIPQVKSDYTPKGPTEEIDGLKIYVTGDKNAKLAIIAIYDVFGFHNNTKQFCDLLSSATGARVVIPDFFRGSQRPENREEMQAWIAQVGNWEKVKKDLDTTLEFLKKDGATKFGTVGFCWGGKIAVEACKNNNTFIGAVAIHPSQKLVTEDAKDLRVPVALLPAKTDSDFGPFMNLLETTDPESFKKSVHRRFDDMHHGFAAARGDWNDPLQAQRANEALNIVATFFKNNA